MSECVAANGKREVGSIEVINIEGNSELLKPAREATQFVQEEEVKTAITQIAHAFDIIPFGQAHTNIKIVPLQFGWYDKSVVAVRKLDKNKSKGKRIHCPLRILCV